LQPAGFIEPSDRPIDNQSQVQTEAATPENGISAPVAPEIKSQGNEKAFAAGAEGHGLPIT
jgi:hypothetical protein